MRTMGISLGPQLAVGAYRIREVGYGPGFRQGTHAHPLMGITLVLGGRIREVSGRREELGQALSVVVKPAGVEHADEVGAVGARTLQMLFDPAAISGLVDAEPGLARWRWLHGGPAADAMLALLKLARAGGASAARAAEERVLDVLGALQAERPAPGGAPRWLGRVKEALDEATGAVPAVRTLARDAGVHEASLSRAFRRHYGCTIGEYRRRARLQRAAARIEAGAEQLSRIAHATGFADHAHLCREFRRATGVTPGEFRGLACGGPRAGQIRSSGAAHAVVWSPATTRSREGT